MAANVFERMDAAERSAQPHVDAAEEAAGLHGTREVVLAAIKKECSRLAVEARMDAADATGAKGNAIAGAFVRRFHTHPAADIVAIVRAGLFAGATRIDRAELDRVYREGRGF